MKKTFAKIIKQFNSNKQVFLASLKTSATSLIKMFLLHRLSKMKYFKPVSLILKIFIKWSSITTVLSLVYSLICSAIGLKYDLTFFIGIFTALWVLFTDFSLDYVFDIWDKILEYYNKILTKILKRLEQNPKTKEESSKIKDMYAKTKESEKFVNQDEVAKYYIEKSKQEHVIKVTPDYTQYNSKSFFNFDFKDILHIAPYIIGAIILVSTGCYYLDQVKAIHDGFVTAKNWLYDFIYVKNCIPTSVRSWFWRKIWPFGNRTPNQTGGENTVPSEKGKGKETETTTQTDDADIENPAVLLSTVPGSILNWIKNLWPFGSKNTTGDTNTTRPWYYLGVPGLFRSQQLPEYDPAEGLKRFTESERIRKLDIDTLKQRITKALGFSEELSHNDFYKKLLGNEIEFAAPLSETFDDIKDYEVSYQYKLNRWPSWNEVLGIYANIRNNYTNYEDTHERDGEGILDLEAQRLLDSANQAAKFNYELDSENEALEWVKEKDAKPSLSLIHTYFRTPSLHDSDKGENKGIIDPSSSNNNESKKPIEGNVQQSEAQTSVPANNSSEAQTAVPANNSNVDTNTEPVSIPGDFNEQTRETVSPIISRVNTVRPTQTTETTEPVNTVRTTETVIPGAVMEDVDISNLQGDDTNVFFMLPFLLKLPSLIKNICIRFISFVKNNYTKLPVLIKYFLSNLNTFVRISFILVTDFIKNNFNIFYNFVVKLIKGDKFKELKAKPLIINDFGIPESPFLNKTYRVNKYSGDLPFKIMVKFFDTLDLDQARDNFNPSVLKFIAQDGCILLNIYFDLIDKNNGYTIAKEVYLGTTNNKLILDFIFSAGDVINKMAVENTSVETN